MIAIIILIILLIRLKTLLYKLGKWHSLTKSFFVYEFESSSAMRLKYHPNSRNEGVEPLLDTMIAKVTTESTHRIYSNFPNHTGSNIKKFQLAFSLNLLVH